MNEGLPLKPGQKITEDELEGLGAVEEEIAVEEEEPDTTPKELPKIKSAEDIEKDKPIICPKCGWDHKTEFRVTYTAEDKENFLRSILLGDDDNEFFKQYYIFNNRIRVTFRQPTLEETEDVAGYIRWLSAGGRSDIRLLFISGLKMSLAMSIHKLEYLNEKGIVTEVKDLSAIRNKLKEHKVEIKDAKDYLCYRVHDHIFMKTFKSPLYTAIYREYQKFDELVQLLTERAADPDFYTATPVSI